MRYVDDADSALDTTISNLTTTVNEIDDRYENITDTLTSNLANETTERTNADTALQNSITSLTNNKMDKANPTGTGTFNLTGLMIPTDGVQFNTLSKVFKLYGDNQSDNIFFETDEADYFKLIDSSGKLYSENSEVARKDYVGTGSLTMQLNGITIDTFSANASANKTVDVKALPNFCLNIGTTNGGYPRPTLFVTIDYNNFTSESGAYFKLSATSCHGNGSSYAFLEDLIISVSYTGAISCNVYKFAQTSCGTYQGADRHYGDVFYVHDSAAKTVKFYILLGQYSSAQFTPGLRLGSSRYIYSSNGITQHTGTPVYYESGDSIWATGNDTTYARLSDLDSYMSQVPKLGSFNAFTGHNWFQNGFSALGTETSPAFSFSDPVNIGMEIGRIDGTPGTPYIDFHTDGKSSTDYNVRLLASGNKLNITASQGISLNGGTISYNASTDTFTV